MKKKAISPFVSLALCLYPYIILIGFLMYHMVMFPRAVEEMFKDLPLYFIVIVLSKLSLYILSLIVAVIGLIFEKDKRYNKLN